MILLDLIQILCIIKIIFQIMIMMHNFLKNLSHTKSKQKMHYSNLIILFYFNFLFNYYMLLIFLFNAF